MDQRAFVLKMRGALLAVPTFESIPEASWPLVVAHAAYESGWGATRQAQRGNNVFNLSAGRSWKGPVLAGGDLEYQPGCKKARRILQQWRCYESTAEAVRDYLQLLQLPRYRPARERLLSADLAGFVRQLGPDHSRERPPVGGYFTLPADEYLAGMRPLLERVLALWP